jgi:hypothetical protein
MIINFAFITNSTNDSNDLNNNNKNDNLKTEKQRILLLESDEFLFDQSVIDGLADDISDSDLVMVLMSMGFTVRLEENETNRIFYIKQTSFFLDRDEKTGINLNNKQIPKLLNMFGCSFLNECNSNIFGNSTDSMNKLCNIMAVYTGKLPEYALIGAAYKKKPIFLNDKQIYIKDIIINSLNNNNINTNLIIDKHPLIRANFFNKLIENFFDVQNKLIFMNNSDISRLDNALNTQGFINKYIYGMTKVFSLDGTNVTLIYTLDPGEKFEFNSVIVHGEQLSNNIINKVTNALNYIYKTSQYFNIDLKFINDILVLYGVGCSEAYVEQLANKKFNIHVIIAEISSNSEQLTNIIFRNFPIKQKILLKLATNYGIYVGEPLNEINVRYFMNTLTSFLGEQPTMEYDKNKALIFGFSKSPNGFKWIKDNLHKAINVTWQESKGALVKFNLIQYQKFAINKSLFYFNVAPSLVWIPSLQKIFENIGISFGGEMEYINKYNQKISISGSIPIYAYDFYNLFVNKYGKLNDVMQLFIPKCKLSLETEKGKFSHGFSINYNQSNSIYDEFSKFGLTEIDKKNEDYQDILKNKNTKNKTKINISYDFNWNIINRKNNQSGFNLNTNIYGGIFDEQLFGGIQLFPSYHKLLQIGDEKLIFSVIGGTGYGIKTTDYLIDTSNDGCAFILLPPEQRVFQSVMGFRLFFIKTLLDAGRTLGLPLGGLAHGLFLNGALFNSISINKKANDELDFFYKYITKSSNGGFPFHLFGMISFGYIIMVEFQQMCFYIAFGFNQEGFAISLGAIQNYNVKMTDNLIHMNN